MQKLFKFDDGERMVAALSLRSRALEPAEENLLARHRKHGFGLRFALAPHPEVSTRAGRRFARLDEGDEIVGVRPAPDDGILVRRHRDAHVLVCDADEVNMLATRAAASP